MMHSQLPRRARFRLRGRIPQAPILRRFRPACGLDNGVSILFPNHQRVAGLRLGRKKPLRQGAFHPVANDPLERPGPVSGVVAEIGQAQPYGILNLKAQVLFRQTLGQTVELQIHDGADFIPGERLEHHDIVDASSSSSSTE